MDPSHDQALFLPAALVAEIESVAAAEARPTREMLRDAVEVYLRERGSPDRSPPAAISPAEAARRMLERRKYHPLPTGETIRSMTIDGRA